MNQFIQVVTTVERQRDAELIAGTVLEKRLVACVQISACASMYHWQGKVAKTDEFVLVMKSRNDLYALLASVIQEIHPYDVPEIIATKITNGNQEYLAWLNDELAK